MSVRSPVPTKNSGSSTGTANSRVRRAANSTASTPRHHRPEDERPEQRVRPQRLRRLRRQADPAEQHHDPAAPPGLRRSPSGRRTPHRPTARASSGRTPHHIPASKPPAGAARPSPAPAPPPPATATTTTTTTTTASRHQATTSATAAQAIASTLTGVPYKPCSVRIRASTGRR
ncbi:hypothetical protein ACFY7H_32245 [Streptomyces sp. NPDC012794]|uniref:hypothetical protein n=1 Tax=Streptomyces sp. NPDC012794 TaxID=3364850 RepID=UPI0036AF33BD